MRQHNGGGGDKPRRARVRHEEPAQHLAHDESNWLVSYADMMTLLFGFFVLMYSMSRIDLDKFEVVRKDIAKHFGGRVESDPMTNELKEMLQQEIHEASLSSDQVQIVASDHGVELRFQGAVLFNSGSAELRPEMQPLMTKLTELILAARQIEEVKVEGHTDDDPIFSPVFPTNWELSAARSSRIVRQFESSGMQPDRLIALGFGASRPVAPNRDESGLPIESNQAQNRRVIINVTFAPDMKAVRNAIEKQGFLKPTPHPRRASKPTGPAAADGSSTMAGPDSAGPGDPEQSGAQELEKKPDILKYRLQQAQARLEEANKRLKEAQEIEKKERELQALQDKIRELESKAIETENKAVQMRQGGVNGLGSDEPRAPSSAGPRRRGDGTFDDGAVPLKQGLQELKQRSKPIESESPKPRR